MNDLKEWPLSLLTATVLFLCGCIAIPIGIGFAFRCAIEGEIPRLDGHYLLAGGAIVTGNAKGAIVGKP